MERYVMQYFDLINKCLVELNYKKVSDFRELTKNDHLKIKNILNIVNAEICACDDWNFLLRKTTLTLPSGVCEMKNSINGRIKTLSIDNSKYNFSEDYEQFLFNRTKDKTYSILNDMLLLPAFNTEKTLNIVYYTNNFSKSSENEEKMQMSVETDETLIPDPFAEPLLVYGTCMKMKANLEYPKFNYWNAMYNKSLANLRSKLCTASSQNPEIRINGVF
ncbi:hypothetical protein IJ818_06015 [bacterium]|nr:hypothetical protein [bacterium]